MYADPFEPEEAVRQVFERIDEQSDNPYFFAIRDKASGKVLGNLFHLWLLHQKNRSVEMGRAILAPVYKDWTATEAQYLLMKYVFEDLNYRRYEWNVIVSQPSFCQCCHAFRVHL